MFIIDTGVERALKTSPDDAAIRGLVAMVMHTDEMVVHHDTKSWLDAQPEPLAGVLLTHLHLDHISGMQDVPRGTPIYVGPGETEVRSPENLVVAANIDRALAGHAPLRQWAFTEDATVIDVFEDGSLFAIAAPGHTPGSTAYLARTPDGPVLFVGDACHTAWGWEHGVEPGEFSVDRPQSSTSLAALRMLAERHPALSVRLGHQALEGTSRDAAPVSLHP